MSLQRQKGLLSTAPTGMPRFRNAVPIRVACARPKGRVVGSEPDVDVDHRRRETEGVLELVLLSADEWDEPRLP